MSRRGHFNEVHPCSNLGHLTPAAFAATIAPTAPAETTWRTPAVSGADAPRPVDHRPARDPSERQVSSKIAVVNTHQVHKSGEADNGHF